MLGRHTGLTLSTHSNIIKGDSQLQTILNVQKMNIKILGMLTSERQWCIELQEGNVVLISIYIETFVANNFLNRVASRRAHFQQAHVARMHFPQFRIRVPMRSQTEVIKGCFFFF